MPNAEFQIVLIWHFRQSAFWNLSGLAWPGQPFIDDLAELIPQRL
jgi:hypothetical protein